jgi:hypothetical protein
MSTWASSTAPPSTNKLSSPGTWELLDGYTLFIVTDSAPEVPRTAEPISPVPHPSIRWYYRSNYKKCKRNIARGVTCGTSPALTKIVSPRSGISPGQIDTPGGAACDLANTRSTLRMVLISFRGPGTRPASGRRHCGTGWTGLRSVVRAPGHPERLPRCDVVLCWFPVFGGSGAVDGAKAAQDSPGPGALQGSLDPNPCRVPRLRASQPSRRRALSRMWQTAQGARAVGDCGPWTELVNRWLTH